MKGMRVVVSGNSGDGFTYCIREFMEQDGLTIILQGDLSLGTSRNQLRKRLEQALAALDLPVVYLHEEWKEHASWKWDVWD